MNSRMILSAAIVFLSSSFGATAPAELNIVEYVLKMPSSIRGLGVSDSLLRRAFGDVYKSESRSLDLGAGTNLDVQKDLKNDYQQVVYRLADPPLVNTYAVWRSPGISTVWIGITQGAGVQSVSSSIRFFETQTGSRWRDKSSIVPFAQVAANAKYCHLDVAELAYEIPRFGTTILVVDPAGSDFKLQLEWKNQRYVLKIGRAHV